MNALHVVRRTHAIRCASCHGDLEATPFECERCGVALHVDCRALLGRCPTLGCDPRARRVEARRIELPREVATPLELRDTALSILVGLLTLFPALVTAAGVVAAFRVGATVWFPLALLHVFAVPALGAAFGRRTRGDAGTSVLDPIATTLGLQLLGSFVAAVALLVLHGGATDLTARLVAFAALVLEPGIAAGLGAAIASAPQVRRSPFEV